MFCIASIRCNNNPVSNRILCIFGIEYKLGIFSYFLSKWNPKSLKNCTLLFTIYSILLGLGGRLGLLFSFRAKVGIFLFYMMRALKLMWVEFWNVVHFFFCTGPNPRWPMVAILEKTKMDRIMSDTSFSWFLESMNMILAIFWWFEAKFINLGHPINNFG